MAMAHAKYESYRLAITRGSDGTPEYMEQQIVEMVKDQPSIKECRIIKG